MNIRSLDELLQSDEKIQKLIRMRRAIDRELKRAGVISGKKKTRRKRDENDAATAQVHDFFDAAEDNASVHDED